MEVSLWGCKPCTMQNKGGNLHLCIIDQKTDNLSKMVVDQATHQVIRNSTMHNQSINQSIKYSFIDKKDNPPDTNTSGFYRRVGGGKNTNN